MRLRPATFGDLKLLKHWHTKPHVRAVIGDFADVDWQAELAHSPDWRDLLICEDAGRAIGLVQIIDPAREESHYWGEASADLRAIDIWIGEECNLGRGLGTRMMGLALERCFAQPEVNAVVVDPLAGNTRAHRFYQRLGFRSVERRTFGKDECVVHRLERDVWLAGSCVAAAKAV